MTLLLIEVCRALQWSQRELGLKVGVSRRTVSRWMARQSAPSSSELAVLARIVYGVNPTLAEQLAAAMGQTLVGLGIAPPPPPPLATPPAPAPKVASVLDLIDCVVCSVAEAADLSPKTVRPMVLLALRRAHELGLDLEKASASVAC
jgi:transcriptional regulator with XRE-family HTH domain